LHQPLASRHSPTSPPTCDLGLAPTTNVKRKVSSARVTRYSSLPHPPRCCSLLHGQSKIRLTTPCVLRLSGFRTLAASGREQGPCKTFEYCGARKEFNQKYYEAHRDGSQSSPRHEFPKPAAPLLRFPHRGNTRGCRRVIPRLRLHVGLSGNSAVIAAPKTPRVGDKGQMQNPARELPKKGPRSSKRSGHNGRMCGRDSEKKKKRGFFFVAALFL